MMTIIGIAALILGAAILIAVAASILTWGAALSAYDESGRDE